MKIRALGGGLEVSALGLGCMGMSANYGQPADKQTGIAPIRAAHGKTPAQVMIRWHLQEGRSAIPKSVRPERIAENFDVFDFELTAEELKVLNTLDTGVRGGPEPDEVTLEKFGRPIPEA